MSIFQSEAEILAVLKQVKRLVVKVGTSTLTYDTGRTNIRRMHKLVSVLSDIVNSGIEVALVTSGAIGVGVGKLGLSARPEDTPGRQAAATVGQCELMFMYDKLFAEYGHTVDGWNGLNVILAHVRLRMEEIASQLEQQGL